MVIFSLHVPIISTPSARIGQTTLKEAADSSSAGYVANYSSLAESVDNVIGYWKVPTVQPSSSQTAVLESIAIGSGDTIIQVGTSQVSHNGGVVYDAWYWAAPEGGGSPATIDQLAGKVTPGLPSAGWLVQPIQPGLPLANFTRMGFFWTNATIDGTESRLDQLQNQRLDLVDPSAQCNLAGTSAIDPSSGDSFTVSFIQPAGPCGTQNTSTIPSFGLLGLLIGGILIAGVAILVVVLVIVSTRKKNVATTPLAWQNLGQTTTPPPVGLCSNCNSPLQPAGRFCDVCGKQVL